MAVLQTSPTYNVFPSKIPPHNIEAEQSVIGSILIDGDSLNKVLEVISADDFYREGHRKIFSAMVFLSERNSPTDILTVSDHLRSVGELEFIGGASYLSGLADSMPSSAHVATHARIIRQKSLMRRLISTASEIATQGFESGEDAETLLDQAEKMIFDVSEKRIRPSFSSVKEVVKESFKRIEKLFESKKQITGVASGFTDLDNLTCGFQPAELIILASRPSMGKTALALNMAEYAAMHESAVVAIFSLEMSKEQLVTRMLCSQARIDSTRLRRGQLEEREWPQLTKAAGHLSDVNIYIDDSPSPTVLEIRAKARRLKKEKGLGMLIVDYLQLIRPVGRTYSNREQEISEISRSLKALAKELDIPVLALSQLNRAVEGRQNKRPQLADLRESGAIEQDADVITFIYRDDVYDPESPNKGSAEILIGKQRNGPTGVCRLAFIHQYTKFENLAFDPGSGLESPGNPTPF